MKRLICTLLLCVLLLAALPSLAETYTGSAGMTVTMNPNGEVESTFRSSDIDRALTAMQPGDDITFTVTLYNHHKETIDWYMLNVVLKSLEDSSIASGGAYEYDLRYTDPKGVNTTLFTSSTVGGENIAAADLEGLHEATSALKDYFRLGSMANGESGVVTLRVMLDGESQGNSYQDTVADLKMKFAAEFRNDTNQPHVVGTGDETNLLPYYLLMAGSGILLLVLAIISVRTRKTGKERSK